MNTNHFILKIIVTCLLVLVMAPSYGFSEWEVYQPITGVGEISQVSPGPSVPNRLNLHYSGGSTAAETAGFYINVSNATDLDCNGDLIRDAFLSEMCTNWQCNPSHGTIDDSMFETTFTPSSGVYSGIWIKVTVEEGARYSYSDGNYDAPVTKQWGSTLTTFKVGVKMQPGNITFWEDDASPEKQEWLHSNLTGLVCRTETTNLGTPGAVSDSGDLSQKCLSWKALANTDSGSIGDDSVMGSIRFTGKIRCNGVVRITGWRAGTTLGSLGTLVSTFAGQVNPYLGAAVSCIVGQPGTKTHYKIQLLGRSVIENGSMKTIGSSGNYVGDQQWAEFYTYALNNLNCSRIFSGNSNESFEGSLDLESLAAVYDNSVTSKAVASVTILSQGSNYYGATRPYYSY